MRHDERKPGGRRRGLLAGLLLVPLALAGCSHTEKGLAAGGVGGAVVGGLVGNALGNTAAGAVIGGATGAIAGGAIGNGVDRAEARAEARAVQAARGPLGLQEVAHMAQSNVGDDVIVQQIQLTGAVYTLNADQIVWLKQQGVSDRVVRTMQTSGGRPAVRYAPPPSTLVVYEQRPVYFAPPPPPPPPMVGVGVHFRR